MLILNYYNRKSYVIFVAVYITKWFLYSIFLLNLITIVKIIILSITFMRFVLNKYINLLNININKIIEGKLKQIIKQFLYIFLIYSKCSIFN